MVPGIPGILLPVVDANRGITSSDEDRVIIDHADVTGDAWDRRPLYDACQTAGENTKVSGGWSAKKGIYIE